ncbi:MAG: FkbM family methyltransferase [Vicinamibacterales bacterium]
MSDPVGDLPEARTPSAKRPKTGPARVEHLRAEVERLSLKARVQLLDGLKPRLVSDAPGGGRFSVRSLSEYKRVMKQKPWDVPIEEWIATFRPSEVFYDIGANTGAFSLLAGRLHGEGVRVVAFEPGFETFESLVQNILLNSLGRVITPLQVALFDETGLRPFNYYNMGAGSARHVVGEPDHSAGCAFEPVAVQPVLAFRLDDLVERFCLPAPTRIKLDVDGVEARVLAGAERTLSAGACELWVELSETGPNDPGPAQIVGLLERCGYAIARRLDHDKAPGVYPRVSDVLFVKR